MNLLHLSIHLFKDVCVRATVSWRVTAILGKGILCACNARVCICLRRSAARKKIRNNLLLLQPVTPLLADGLHRRFSSLRFLATCIQPLPPLSSMLSLQRRFGLSFLFPFRGVHLVSFLAHLLVLIPWPLLLRWTACVHLGAAILDKGLRDWCCKFAL